MITLNVPLHLIVLEVIFFMPAKHIKGDFEGFFRGAKKIEAPSKNPTKSPIMCFTSMQKITSLYRPRMAVR